MADFPLLVDCSTLQEHLDDPDWQVIDCRFRLDDPQAGRHAWKYSHIPGAMHADVESDLSGPVGAGTGRHPLPSREQLADLFNLLGISNDSRVVAYDDTGGCFAARLWWLLRWMGHEKVALLDGGWTSWTEGAFPVSNRPPRIAEAEFIAHAPLVDIVRARDILAAINTGSLQLVDARAAERFSGEIEPLDPVAGHIPGAINRPFAENLDEAGHFLPAGELRERFAVGDPAMVVHYCGSGVTACHNLFAMDQAGLHGSRLYPGSWSEWVSDSTRPVAQAQEQAQD